MQHVYPRAHIYIMLLEKVRLHSMQHVYPRAHLHIPSYIHTSPGSPERLVLRLEHVDQDVVVDVVACVRVDLGHVRACVTSLSS